MFVYTKMKLQFDNIKPIKWVYLYELSFQGEVKFKLYFKSGGAIDFGTAMLKAAQMGKKIYQLYMTLTWNNQKSCSIFCNSNIWFNYSIKKLWPECPSSIHSSKRSMVCSTSSGLHPESQWTYGMGSTNTCIHRSTCT